MKSILLVIVLIFSFSGCAVKPTIVTPFAPIKGNLVERYTINKQQYETVHHIDTAANPYAFNSDLSIVGAHTPKDNDGNFIGGLGLSIPLSEKFILKNEFSFFYFGFSTALIYREKNNFAIAFYNRTTAGGLKAHDPLTLRNNFFPGMLATKAISIRYRIYYGTFCERSSLNEDDPYALNFDSDLGDAVMNLGLIIGIDPVELRVMSNTLNPEEFGWSFTVHTSLRFRQR